MQKNPIAFEKERKKKKKKKRRRREGMDGGWMGWDGGNAITRSPPSK
jgi:hypothetical protein